MEKPAQYRYLYLKELRGVLRKAGGVGLAITGNDDTPYGIMSSLPGMAFNCAGTALMKTHPVLAGLSFAVSAISSACLWGYILFSRDN